MKTNLLLRSPSPTMLVLAFALLAPLARAEDRTPGQSAPLPSPRGLISAEQRRGGHSARELLGQDVRSTDGENLGEIKDLVVDPQNGRILLALLSSGGIAGIGARIHALPFSAIGTAAPTHGAITVDLRSTRWADAPVIDKGYQREIDAAQVRDAYRFFGHEIDEGSPMGSKLLRVSDLLDMDVKHQGRAVGDVEDVLVDVGSQRASVLLDAEHDFAGSDEEFVIRFSRLSPGTEEGQLATTLTPDDFRRAQPMQDSVSAEDYDFPYRWTGYLFKWNTLGDPTAHVEGAQHTASKTGTRRELMGRPSVGVVRGALRSSTELSEQARLATITRDGNQLVIEGTVRSPEMKEKVAEIAEEAAEGAWQIDNRLSVSASE